MFGTHTDENGHMVYTNFPPSLDPGSYDVLVEIAHEMGAFLVEYYSIAPDIRLSGGKITAFCGIWWGEDSYMIQFSKDKIMEGLKARLSEEKAKKTFRNFIDSLDMPEE